LSITHVQRCNSTKLELGLYVFLFLENWRHGTDGRTDGLAATLNAVA